MTREVFFFGLALASSMIAVALLGWCSALKHELRKRAYRIDELNASSADWRKLAAAAEEREQQYIRAIREIGAGPDGLYAAKMILKVIHGSDR